MEVNIIPADYCLSEPVGVVVVQKLLWRVAGIWCHAKDGVLNVGGSRIAVLENQIAIPMMELRNYNAIDFFAVWRKVSEERADVLGYAYAFEVFQKKGNGYIKGTISEARGGKLVVEHLRSDWSIFGGTESKPVQHVLGV